MDDTVSHLTHKLGCGFLCITYICPQNFIPSMCVLVTRRESVSQNACLHNALHNMDLNETMFFFLCNPLYYIIPTQGQALRE